MLKEHNQEAYEAIKKMLKAYKECCIVAATGIGKSNIVTELIRDLKLNAMIIVPKKSLESEWSNIYEKYDTEYFSVVTYHYFNIHYKNLYGFDAYIFDEAHHMGAKEWSKIIKEFKSELIDELFIGATADDNRYFDEDIKTVANTFFNGDHIVYGLDQQEAIEKGILPKAKYVCAIYNIEEVFTKYKTIELSDELKGKLNYTVQNCQSIESILQENIPNNSPVKGIIFVDTVRNIDTGVELIKKAFPNEQVYFIHSKLGKGTNKRILNEFRTAKSGFIVNVNMLNEGNHIEGVNTIIMLRKTSSPSLYTQQIGRGLSANCNDVTIFDLVRNDTSVKNMLSRLGEMSKIYNNKEGENRIINKEPKISNQFIVKDYARDILKVFEDINKYISQKSKNDNKWTEEEDEILKQNYPTMGGDVCKLLPNRSILACKNRAKKLKLLFISNKWTPEEDELIRKYYPTMGSHTHKKVPNRSKHACIDRARFLNIKYRRRVWTPEEDEIIRQHYPTMGKDIILLLPDKNIQSCKNRASVLGIKESAGIWTEKEDDLIRQLYPIIGIKVYKLLDNRSISAIQNRVYTLGIECDKNKRWTEEEDEIIRQYYPTMGGNTYKLLNGRSKGGTEYRASVLNIKMDNVKWTEEEDEILKQNYPTMGGDVCKLLPNRTKNACIGRSRYLDLKRDNFYWTKEEDEILKQNYPIIRMDVYRLLPNRNMQSIKARIRSLKLRLNLNGDR